MRGKAEFKTMEFDESGVCKNALSDNIETKNYGELQSDLNEPVWSNDESFVGKAGLGGPFKEQAKKAILRMKQQAKGKDQVARMQGKIQPETKTPVTETPKLDTAKEGFKLPSWSKKVAVGTGILGTGAAGGYLLSGEARDKLFKQ